MKLRNAMLIMGVCATQILTAQTYTPLEMEQLTVNENVTTVITASEPIYFVDISTDKVFGDQPMENTIRLKPKGETDTYVDGQLLAVATIVTERYRTQYALIYTSRVIEAVTDKTVSLIERNAYHNQAVSLTVDDMARYARLIWNSPAKYRNVMSRAHRMTMRLNNVYAVGDYFFIDFSVENNTNIRFDIDQMRVQLEDKKQTKATNCQIIEMKPAFVLENPKFFRHGYRNVIVLPKMTFPDDKVLRIELHEKQISGRNISLTIDYEDVLYADSFDKTLLRED